MEYKAINQQEPKVESNDEKVVEKENPVVQEKKAEKTLV